MGSAMALPSLAAPVPVRLSVLAAIEKIGPLAAPLAHDIALLGALGGSTTAVHCALLVDESKPTIVGNNLVQ